MSNKQKLGNFIKLQGGYAFKSSDFSEQGVPIVRISNIRNNKLDFSDAAFYNNQIKNNLSDYLIEEDDVLIAMSGATTGKVGIASKDNLPAIVNQRVGRFVIQDKEKLSQKFLRYLVQSSDFINQVNIHAIGGAQPNISATQIESISLYIPELIKEQQKIAEILSSVDAAIEKTEQVIAKTEEVKKGLMQQLLTKGIGHTEFKQTEIGEIPENWDIKHLGDITKVCVGFVGSINAYYTNDKENGVLLLRTSNISSEGLNLTDTKYVTKEFHAKNKKSQLSSGDIIISRHGESGTASVIPESIVEANCLNVVCVKKTKEIDSFYLEALFNSEIIKRQMKQAVVGSVQGVVNTTTISNALIPIPPTEEQKEIRSILFSLNNKISNELKKLHKINIIKQGLMQQLLTGKVRVKID